MKPIIRLHKKTKETYFQLLLDTIMHEIDEVTKQWVEDLFVQGISVSEEEHTEELKQNLNYLFSKGVWIIEMSESFGFEIDTTAFASRYECFTTVKDGYRLFVAHKYYDCREHRLLNEEERNQKNKEMFDFTQHILQGVE